MSAVPKDRVTERGAPIQPVLVRVPPRRRRRWHVAAAVAALAYAGAAALVVLIVLPVLEHEAPRESGIAPVTVAAPGLAAAPAPRELLAMRALASRAQRGVYVLEAGGRRGSAFVAWAQPRLNRTYLLTARAVVAGLLADGGRSVFVRRGPRFWDGRLWAADKETGLALVRVDAVFRSAQWQDDDRPGTLSVGGRTFVVPPGDAAFGESDVRPGPPGRFALTPGYDPLFLGAPVVNESGRVGGVVVAADPRGTATVVPLAAACQKLRRCASD